MIEKKIPIKPIRRVIQYYFKGEISQNTCEYVRDILLEIVTELTKNAIIELNRYNKRREQQGLYRVKRLNIYTFQKAKETLYKPVEYNKNGKGGKGNDKLLCQDGTSSTIEHDSAIKDAGIEVT